MAAQRALQYGLTFTHSCTHSDIDGGVNHARQQPAVRVRRLAQGDLDAQEEPGIELATFRLPANPLYLLSHMPL